MKTEEIQIRQSICRKCKTKCPEYGAGQIEHTNPCVACPIGVWHAFEDPGCPKAGPVAEPAPAPEELRKGGSGIPRFSKEPGSMLKWVIWKTTGILPCNRCDARAKQMNEWGWTGCFQHRETIIDWLVHEAQARGHKIERKSVLPLLLAAVKEIRKGG